MKMLFPANSSQAVAPGFDLQKINHKNAEFRQIAANFKEIPIRGMVFFTNKLFYVNHNTYHPIAAGLVGIYPVADAILFEDICKTCGISIAGEEAGLVTDTTKEEPVNTFPLSFRWSNAEPFQGPGFDSLLASIKAGMATDNKLEITGLYFEEESTPADVETMGLARAAKIRDKFFGDIPADRISLRSRLVDETAGVQDNYFEAALFKWIAIEKKLPKRWKNWTTGLLSDSRSIQQKRLRPQCGCLPGETCQAVNQTGEEVKLTGHTDNVGDDAANLVLEPSVPSRSGRSWCAAE